MAYMSQEKKAKIAPVVKAICKKYGIKATLAVDNHSSLVLNIKSGRLNLIGNYYATCDLSPRWTSINNNDAPRSQYIQVNPYWFHEHFSGECKAFLTEVKAAMMDGNHDNSDIMTDYFDVGWYVNINVGRWNKPYLVT